MSLVPWTPTALVVGVAEEGEIVTIATLLVVTLLCILGAWWCAPKTELQEVTLPSGLRISIDGGRCRSHSC